jgi:hypothetical protein
MGRHHLVERASPRRLLRVVSDIGGLHAQLMSSAELTLWARVDGLRSDAVENALWTKRSLVKLWAMRGTLHLLPAAELGTWLAALSTVTDRGMTGHPEVDAITEATGRALRGRVLTREELAAEVERITGDPSLAEHIGFSWGSYLKPASFRGLLCFAPGDDNRVRFTSTATWVPGIELSDHDDALREVARRFLAAYAPAGAQELAIWSGFSRARTRRMLAALGDEVVELDVEGDRVMALARDVRELATATPPGAARLLPAFDQYVVGAARDSPAVLDPRHKVRVYRPQGWLSPVILVDGRIAGVWRHTRKGRRILVELEPFGRLPAWARPQLEEEAERLAAFLDCDLELR